MDFNLNSELVGISEQALLLKGTELRTTINLDSSIMGNVSKSLMKAAATNTRQIHLHIKNMKGSMDANILEILVNQQHVGHVALYGLSIASWKTTEHNSGKGLTFSFDITNIINKLHLKDTDLIKSLDIQILPSYPIPDEYEINIEQISLHRTK